MYGACTLELAMCDPGSFYPHISSPSPVDSNPRVSQNLDGKKKVNTFLFFFFFSPPRQIFVSPQSITAAVSPKDCVLD